MTPLHNDYDVTMQWL